MTRKRWPDGVGKGNHVYVPLDDRLSSEQVSNFARELARSLETDPSDEVVSTMRKPKRNRQSLHRLVAEHRQEDQCLPLPMLGH